MSASENGWQPAWVDQNSLEWVTIPGTTVNLQIMKGQPKAVMRAFAADFNAYVEPLRDRDSASYTPTNSVSTSNHLNGTAMDLNWDSHAFHVKGTFGAGQMRTIRELLDFYEGTIFWAGDWTDPIDEMHWQMGYGTYGNPKVASFIARKIRSDGYSTFRRGPIQAETKLTQREMYAQDIIAEGQRRGITPRGIVIALATALVESDLVMYANAKVPESMSIPHEAVGSDGMSVGLFQQQVIASNGQWWWGDAATCMDPVKSAGLFYDRLARLDYNGPNSPGWYAQAVQRSAYPDRYDEHMDDAQALYDRLITTTSQPPTTTGGFLMALSDAEQREVLELLRQQASYRKPSRSPLRHVGEGAVDTIAGFELNTDAATHVLLVQALARLGDPDSLNLLNEVASLDTSRYPDRAHDRQLATAILNDLAGEQSVGTAPPSGQTPGVILAPPVIPAPPPVLVAPAAPVPIAPAPVAALPPSVDVTTGFAGGLLGEITSLTQKLRDVSATVTQIVEGDTK